MGRRVKKLTPNGLKKIIFAEARKIQREMKDPIAKGVSDPEKVKAEEVDADEFADTLEKDIDFMKVLKIQEKRLRAKLKKVAEAKEKLGKRIVSKL